MRPCRPQRRTRRYADDFIVTGYDIVFDNSERSVVAVCTCGAREVATRSEVAYAWATDHMQTAHPAEVAVLVAARLRAGRHRYR